MAACQSRGRPPVRPPEKRRRIVLPAMRRKTAEGRRDTRLLYRAACISGMPENKAAQMQQPPGLYGLKSMRPLLRAPDEQQITGRQPQQLCVAALVQVQRGRQIRQQRRPRDYLIDGRRRRSSRQLRNRECRITNEEGNS